MAPEISPVNDTQEASRQAIFDAIHRHAPELAETPDKFRTHPELTLDWLYSLLQGEAHESPVRLMTSWSDFRQRFGGLFRAHRGNPLAEEPRPERRVIVGTAELLVEKSWRYCPGHQPRDVVREGILDEFRQALDRELDVVYAAVKQAESRPPSLRYRDRDATRLVLREYLGLNYPKIVAYENGINVELPDGRLLRHPDGGEEETEEPLNQDDGRRLRKRIDKSIRNFAQAAGIALRPRPLGRPPNPDLHDDPIWRDFLRD